MALINLITSPDSAIRDQSLDTACGKLTLAELLTEADTLDAFRRSSDNLYHRVRALLFLYSIHRFHIPSRLVGSDNHGAIPFKGYENLLDRRFEEAIDIFLKFQTAQGPGDGVSSALASVYQRLAFQTLADQVRRSVRSVSGNQWMFRMGHPADQPLRIRQELTQLDSSTGTYPILRERTPVRMDLTHCGWSDIFFLGMDHPEGAKVLNISIDLAVHGSGKAPSPPVEASLRVIEEPVLRLTSVDLGCSAEISSLNEVFDFAKDYLGLLKAAVIASGIVPPGIEGSGQSLADLLESAGRGPFVDWLSVGIGVNLQAVPDGITGPFPPVSLKGEGGADVTAQDFLTTLAGNYATQELKLSALGFARIREDWLRHAAKLGEVITARTGKDVIKGIFDTVDEDGNLVLITGMGPRAIPAADVFI